MAIGTVRVANSAETRREGATGVPTTLGGTVEGLVNASATRFRSSSMYSARHIN